MRRFFLGFLALLVALGVASCGGGGGYDGETGQNNALRMSPLLSDVGLSVGYVAEVAKISQGVKPYYVLSSDRSVGAMLSDDDTLLVRGYSLGTSTVTVQDSSLKQNQIQLTVTVKAQPLATSAGTKMTLAAGESRTFTVTGGVAPYTVASNNNSIATASINGDGVVTVNGQSVGDATLLITDSVGSTLEVSITVAAQEFKINPGTVSAQVGSERLLSILGGTGPFTVMSSTPVVAAANLSGSNIRISFLAVGSSTITVMDSNGQMATATVTVTEGATTALSASPTAAGDLVGRRVIFILSGGTAPYTAVSSNPSRSSTSISGTTLTVTLLDEGTSTITIRDARGATITVSVTGTAPTPVPAALTVSPQNKTVLHTDLSSVTYAIQGGTGPYVASVASADSSIASASVSGTTLTIDVGTNTNRCIGNTTRLVQVTVTDSKGVTATATETIQGATGACP